MLLSVIEKRGKHFQRLGIDQIDVLSDYSLTCTLWTQVTSSSSLIEYVLFRDLYIPPSSDVSRSITFFP